MVQENPDSTLLNFTFKKDSDREEVVERIEGIRATNIYLHPSQDCTPECKGRVRLMHELSTVSHMYLTVDMFHHCRLWCPLGDGWHMEIVIST